MRFTYVIGAALLAEGYLRRGDCAAARPLIDHVLETSWTTGYLHYEGRACWLMAECLAAEAPATAGDYVEKAIQIFEEVGARSDLAKAMLTRAALCQGTGDLATARQLLDNAHSIFRALRTLDEPARVESALAALDRGAPIPLLAG